MLRLDVCLAVLITLFVSAEGLQLPTRAVHMQHARKGMVLMVENSAEQAARRADELLAASEAASSEAAAPVPAPESKSEGSGNPSRLL